jgi:hypothetical protein
LEAANRAHRDARISKCGGLGQQFFIATIAIIATIAAKFHYLTPPNHDESHKWLDM